MSSTSTKPQRTGGVVGRGGGSPKPKSWYSDDSIARSLLRTQSRSSFDQKNRGAARRTWPGRVPAESHSSLPPGGNQHDGTAATRDGVGAGLRSARRSPMPAPRRGGKS